MAAFNPYAPLPYTYPTYPYVTQPMTQPAPQPQPQGMTPPVIHADIIPVADEAEADRYPMSAGQPPQMFMKRDESEIYIKTMLANNQHELAVYPKRPAAPKFDPGEYVTREELEKRLAALSGKEEA